MRIKVNDTVEVISGNFKGVRGIVQRVYPAKQMVVISGVNIVKKHQRRFKGFDDKIISMYARGMTTRDIQGHLKDIYGVDVSPDLISNVTDEVIKDVREWQNRPLDEVYPLFNVRPSGTKTG